LLIDRGVLGNKIAKIDVVNVVLIGMAKINAIIYINHVLLNTVLSINIFLDCLK